ncbi:MAG: L,D-transpeptidase [Gammaproteobacteria bacterium]|nr:L,D-transpeptidase [Gammaproteobacteria bacterium]
MNSPAQPPRIRVDLPAQTLTLFSDAGADGGDGAAIQYRVSTAANGAGEVNGSFRTPRGRHIIRAKIGGGAPLGGVFVARRPTGEIFTVAMRAAAPQRDWILTRILWLSGCEPGRNRLGQVDSMRRYIYIHGAPDDVSMGRPGSRGCIRMRNRDVVDLFDRVAVGTTVDIHG